MSQKPQFQTLKTVIGLPIKLRKHGILKTVRNGNKIVIVRPENGSGVTILNRDLYDRKILKTINNTVLFKKLKEHPTLTWIGQLQRF